MSMDLDRALQVAREAAARADRIAMQYFKGELAVERKSDASPVTEADRACERAIRETLLGAFPDHAIYGEEYGQEGDGDVLWLVDPIDGTRSFIRGLPFWSVQIALMVEGELVLGVSSAPAFEEVAWAVHGRGAWIDEQAVRCQECSSIDEADLSFGNLRSLARSKGWSWAGELFSRAARSRAYGDFYSYHRLADGAQDGVIESDVNILDIAALTVLVREAGAVITDLDGAPIGLETRSILAASPRLHELLLSSRHG
ncbi:MAG: inositol monophosphatase family protein [Pseudomonadota bacterium]